MPRLPPLPAAPRPPQRTPFPLIAVIAPVVGAVAIGAIMRSPFVLVFAILSPLIALATMVDGRRHARAHRRAEAARFDRETAAFEVAIDQAHRDESARARADVMRQRADAGHTVGVLVGTAPAPSSVVADLPMPLDEDEPAQRIRAMITRASTNLSLPAVVPRGHVTIVGRGLAADALERRLSAEPGVVVSRTSESAPSAHDGADAVTSVIEVSSATHVVVREGERTTRVRTVFDSAAEPRGGRVGNDDESRTGQSLPDRVVWSSLAHAGEGFSVPVGRDARGVVAIDLVSHGPHAIIGGTTGSGKSELMRSLALGWAAAASPMRAQILCVDFKGGATFTGLTELPHCAGIVTDLDGAGATRVLQSLRTEVRRRERLLAEHAVRDLSEYSELAPRLLVLIDEFAAMLDEHPELAPLVADLVARGRSLGMHLVICTQTPGATVREAVAANCPVRVSFRVTEPAAAAFLGRTAPDLLGVGPGRALAVGLQHVGERGAPSGGETSNAESRSVQVAVISESDIEEVRSRWADAARPPAPWIPPLPLDIARHSAEEIDDSNSHAVRGEALLFGLVDRPDEQRRARAEWHLGRDGTLAVVGAARSGKTTALATFESSGREAGFEPVILAHELPDAWATLERLHEHDARVLLIADDLDGLVARVRDTTAELLDVWDDAVMSVLERGGAVVAALSAAAAARGPLATRFSSRLILRTSDAEEHALVGGPRGGHDREAPPGRGWWQGRLTQVIRESTSLGEPERIAPATWRMAESSEVAFVCRRPERVAALLATQSPQCDVVTDLAGCLAPRSPGEIVMHPRALVGTPAAWQSAFASWQSWRARTDIVFIGVSPADARALLGFRGALPPLDVSRGDVWVVSAGELPRRERWPALVV